MTMKQKLIDIIDDFRQQDAPNDNRNWSEHFADHLIKNGIIVPPCKVGQKVYVMESEFTGFWECIILSMLYDGVQWLGQLTPLSKFCHGSRWKWQEAEFGKTIFFTREEAKIAQKKAETKEE